MIWSQQPRNVNMNARFPKLITPKCISIKPDPDKAAAEGIVVGVNGVAAVVVVRGVNGVATVVVVDEV